MSVITCSVAGTTPVLAEGVRLALSAAEINVVDGTDSPQVGIILEGSRKTVFAHMNLISPTILVTERAITDDDLCDAVAAGVFAFVDPRDGIVALRSAIASIAHGVPLLTTTQLLAISQRLQRNRSDTAEIAPLTGRERDVLRQFTAGKSVQQAALELGISAKTVENTQRLLYRKLGVRSRAQAVALSHSMRLLSC